MNFQQLRIIREAVRRKFNLTEVAQALATSQSGVSKHIKDLEEELGVELFVRHGKRLLELTDPGQAIIEIVERILNDASDIRRISDQLSRIDHGELIIATTHTQARYVLPPVISAFRKSFPNVRLVLHQKSPPEIATMLRAGEADIGIATEAVSAHPELAAFPYYAWHHVLIVQQGHPLQSRKKLRLADLVHVPLITYHDGFTGRSSIDRAFERAGLKPDIVMTALDSDVIKAYVRLGMGIGIIASMAAEASADEGLAIMPLHGLIEENISYIAIRRRRYLRGFAYKFIELCRSDLSPAEIQKQLAKQEGASFR